MLARLVLRILHTNDLHGRLDEALADKLAPLREQAHLYLDSGDVVKAGNLAVPLRPDPCWDLLARLRCSASTLGNRESQPLAPAFRKKIAGLAHPVVCANLAYKDGRPVFPASIVLEVGDLRVGVIGAMVPVVTEKMASAPLSNFLWSAPIPSVVAATHRLRPQCDVLFALTHIGIAQDRKLAVACPQLDAIFGGHSHTVLVEPERVGGVWICHGGSHGRFAGRYGLDLETKQMTGGLESL